MTVRSIPIHCLVFLLGVLSYLSIYVHAYHDVLETTVVDENNRDINLKWVKTKRSFLANQNLPIWNIWDNGKWRRHSRNNKEKNDFFDYTAYHDYDKFSAVIYVKKFNCLIGVIDTRYSIECLPVPKLHKKHHIVKNRAHGYIIHINSDHRDSTGCNNPGTIPNLLNPSSSKSGSIPPHDSASFHIHHKETSPQSAHHLDLTKVTNINSKELPSTSFNPDSSLSPGPKSFINPSFSSTESSIILNNKASSPLSPNVDVVSDLANSYFLLVSRLFEHSGSSLPSGSASSANPSSGFDDCITLSDNHKFPNDPPPLSPNADLLCDSDSLNIDDDDTLLKSEQNLDFTELTDTDLERLLPKSPDTVSSVSRDFASPINLPSSDSNRGLPHSSESPVIHHEEILPLLDPLFPINFDFSALTDTVNEQDLPSTSSIDSLPIKRPRIEKRSNEKQFDTLYPEIVVFISNDMVQYEKNIRGPKSFMPWLVYRFIAYFNAVDMLFAQLKNHGIDIHVNIAGIIIENHPDAWEIRLGNPDHIHVMDKSSALDLFHQIIKKNCHVIDIDTFDFFHVATFAKSNGGDHNYGFSTERFSIYDQRANKVSRDDMKFAGSIVRHPKFMQNYVVAAREIAHLMEVDYDTTENLFGNDAQCHGVMQENNISCLKWSDKSIESFKKYLSESLNRCFLLNQPKSLYPYNKPIELISPAKMCSCYAQQELQHSEIIKSNAMISENCNAPMVCYKADDSGVLKQITPLPFPLEGTGCGKNKVCFNRICIETSVENRHKDM